MDRTTFRWRLLRADTGESLVDFVAVACSFWPRFAGLMFRAPLAERHALLLVPCRSVHTMWMRFPIDLFFLSSDARVIEIRRDVRPWRAVTPKSGRKPHAVLETGVGQLDVELGTVLTIESDAEPVPAAIRFLRPAPVGFNEE